MIQTPNVMIQTPNVALRMHTFITHLLWKRLLLSIREIKRSNVYKLKLIEHIWAAFIRPFDTADPDESY